MTTVFLKSITRPSCRQVSFVEHARECWKTSGAPSRSRRSSTTSRASAARTSSASPNPRSRRAGRRADQRLTENFSMYSACRREQCIRVGEQEAGEPPPSLGLTDTRGPGEDERPDRPFGVLETGPATAGWPARSPRSPRPGRPRSCISSSMRSNRSRARPLEPRDGIPVSATR